MVMHSCAEVKRLLNGCLFEGVRYVEEAARRYNIILGRQKNLAYIVGSRRPLRGLLTMRVYS